MAAPPANDFKSMLGEFAQDKALEGVNDAKQLAKMYVDTKKMVGSKPFAVPQDTDPVEKWNDFYKAMGVPEKADGYQLKAPENIPDALKGMYDANGLKVFSEIAHEAKLTPKQAQIVQQKYDEWSMKQLGEMKQDISRSDEQFDKMATEFFGEKKGEALEKAGVMVKKYLPASLQSEAGGLPNVALLVLAKALDAQARELGGDDKAFTGGSAGASKDVASLRADLTAIQSNPGYNNSFDPSHAALNTQARDIAKQLAALGQKR
jgi:hypothetical protein